MGFIVRLKKKQRLFIGNLTLEVDKAKGQFQIYIDGPKPFDVEVNRETNDKYYERIRGAKDEQTE